MTDMNKIAEKIQKLLALSGNNPSEEEAQSALLAAQRLMARYNIEENELNPNTERVEYSLVKIKVRCNPRSKILWGIFADSFAVKAIRFGTELGYFGRKMNAEAAKSALEFCYPVLKRGMIKACKDKGFSGTHEAGSSLVYNAYADGFIRGLREAMAAQTKALTVVVPEDVKNAFYERFPNCRTGRAITMRYSRDNMDSYNNGRADGRHAMDKRSLNAGV